MADVEPSQSLPARAARRVGAGPARPERGKSFVLTDSGAPVGRIVPLHARRRRWPSSARRGEKVAGALAIRRQSVAPVIEVLDERRSVDAAREVGIDVIAPWRR